MSYTIDRTISGDSFDYVVDRTKAALTAQGFGVLTQIDVKATMKSKLDRDMQPYQILGACNPKLAFEALQAEPNVGAMLPCNVIVRAIEGGDVVVSAIDPVASMQAIDNSGLKDTASKVRTMLSDAVAAI
jgi:uncharacterized protein (DUF302 family)